MISEFPLAIKNLLTNWKLEFSFELVSVFNPNNIQNLFKIYLKVGNFKTIYNRSRFSWSLKDYFLLPEQSKRWNNSNFYRFFDGSIIIESRKIGKGQHIVIFFKRFRSVFIIFFIELLNQFSSIDIEIIGILFEQISFFD